MARVANIEIPSNKRGEIALTYIYGVGRILAREILEKSKVDINKKVVDWQEKELDKIRQFIAENYIVEGDLRRKERNNKARLYEIGSRRGIRLKNGLPVRGQNTKNNSRTHKGKKKTIANKKKVTR